MPTWKRLVTQGLCFHEEHGVRSTQVSGVLVHSPGRYWCHTFPPNQSSSRWSRREEPLGLVTANTSELPALTPRPCSLPCWEGQKPAWPSHCSQGLRLCGDLTSWALAILNRNDPFLAGSFKKTIMEWWPVDYSGQGQGARRQKLGGQADAPERLQAC